MRSWPLQLLSSIAVITMTVGCGAAAAPPTAPTVQAAASELAPTIEAAASELAPTVAAARTEVAPTVAAAAAAATQLAPTVAAAQTDIAPTVEAASSLLASAVASAQAEIAPTVEAASSQLASAVASAQAEIAPTVEALEPTVAAIQTQVAPTVAAIQTQVAPTVAALGTSVAATIQPPIATSIAASPVEIADVQVSQEDTTVTFRSRGTQPANLSYWVLTIGTFPYVLPVNQYLRLDPNETVKLHFSRGTDTETDVYVGQAPERLVESMQPGTLFVLIDREPTVASIYRIP